MLHIAASIISVTVTVSLLAMLVITASGNHCLSGITTKIAKNQ